MKKPLKKSHRMETTKEFSQFWEIGLTGIAATNRLSATGDQAICYLLVTNINSAQAVDT